MSDAGGVGASPCRICNGSTQPAFSTTDRNRRLSAERFDYVHCQRCGTLALANVPADLGRFYPPDYYRVPATRAELLSGDMGAERAKLALLRPFAPRGRLVEIGPGVGAFVALAQEAGYVTEAVEMDHRCAEFLELQLGVTTVCSDDPAAALAANGPFDVIALWQVIEHLPDPPAVIRAAARALAPGGLLALAAPNPDSFQLGVFGARWTHIDAPRHLFLIPAPTLVRIGAEHGLEAVLETETDVSAINWNRFGWRESLASMVSGGRAAGAMRLAGSVIARFAAPVERRPRRAATYTLLLRRPAA